MTVHNASVADALDTITVHHEMDSVSQSQSISICVVCNEIFGPGT